MVPIEQSTAQVRELSERQTFELPADVRDELFAIADMGVHQPAEAVATVLSAPLVSTF